MWRFRWHWLFRGKDKKSKRLHTPFRTPLYRHKTIDIYPGSAPAPYGNNPPRDPSRGEINPKLFYTHYVTKTNIQSGMKLRPFAFNHFAFVPPWGEAAHYHAHFIPPHAPAHTIPSAANPLYPGVTLEFPNNLDTDPCRGFSPTAFCLY